MAQKGMKLPLITTIIPTYKRAQYLPRAISSALQQTEKSLIVAVYDNASQDETENVVREIAKQDPRVRYYCHPQNIGLQSNFNFALQQVETPFFSFLGDDDCLLPDFYEKALQSLRSYSEAAFFAGSVYILNPKRNIKYTEKCLEGYFEPPFGAEQMILKGFPNWTSVLFKKSILSKIPHLDSHLPYAFDMDFLLKSALHFPFIAVKRPFSMYTVHLQRASFEKGFQKDWEELHYIKQHLKTSALKTSFDLFMKRSAFTLWLQALALKRMDDAFMYPKLLCTTYNTPLLGRFFYFITSMFKSFPFILKFLYLLQHLRKKLLKKVSQLSKSCHTNSEIKQYLDFYPFP